MRPPRDPAWRYAMGLSALQARHPGLASGAAAAPPPPAIESTTTLLRQLQAGDSAARDRLIARCLPLLRRWAHGRLPAAQRDLSETADLVQVALMRVIDRLADFEGRGAGCLLAYLRQVVLNEIRDQARVLARAPQRVALADDLADSGASVVQHAIDAETIQSFERALVVLDPHQRDAVLLRIEFGMSYAEIALELALPSGDAARMVVARALARLAKQMS